MSFTFDMSAISSTNSVPNNILDNIVSITRKTAGWKECFGIYLAIKFGYQWNLLDAQNCHLLSKIHLFACNDKILHCIFSPTLYVGEYEHGLYALPALVDEKTVTIAVSITPGITICLLFALHFETLICCTYYYVLCSDATSCHLDWQ